MKASRYNKLFQASNGAWLAFNSWSTALAEIEPGNLDFFRALLDDPDHTPCDTKEKREMREAMLGAHFLIEDELDEMSTLKADIMRDRFGTEKLFLTIAPTLNCNFRCDYCYEEHLKITMSKPVEDALIRWVKKKAPASRELLVTWYGGEPLMPQAFPVVERLSQAFMDLAKEHEMKYFAHLVTNGYFLDRDKMESLTRLGVGKVQVTLDGPPEIHDQRRFVVGGKGSFHRIIENMKQTVDLAEFQTRINVDRRNALSTLEITEILAKEGLLRKVRPYLAQVVADGETCGNIDEMCFSSEDFAKTEMEIYQASARQGYPLSRYPSRTTGAFCMAEKLNGFVIAPNGSIFKCWHEVTPAAPERSVGSLLDGQQLFQKHNEDKWLGWDALEKSGCRSCEILPICHGGCPLQARKHPESDRGACDHCKFHLDSLLELHYLRPVDQVRAQKAQEEGEAAG